MVTLGGVFPALTVTFTTLDVVERPALSVATAVSAWAPAARAGGNGVGCVVGPAKKRGSVEERHIRDAAVASPMRWR